MPGQPDLLDVTYNVEEQPSGSVSASVGFSQSAGVIYGVGLAQNNFLGTGNRVNVGAQRSDTFTSVNFAFTDPYWTLDGISRGYNVFYRETDYADSDISTFSTDATARASTSVTPSVSCRGSTSGRASKTPPSRPTSIRPLKFAVT